jgi:hypothetical protein
MRVQGTIGLPEVGERSTTHRRRVRPDRPTVMILYDAEPFGGFDALRGRRR